MNAIADGLNRNALFQALNRQLENPLARRALLYADKQPELLYLAVCVLQLAHVDTVPELGRLGPDLLKGLVRVDCGFYHFAVEWCRVYSQGEDGPTRELRAQLVEQLGAVLREECQHPGLAAGGTPPRARKLRPHKCWSMRASGQSEAGACPATVR